MFCGPLLRSVAAIEPNMSFADFANRAAPNQLHPSTQTVLGASLVAHLRNHFVLRRRLAHHSRFMHGASQRLLAINVLAALHRRHRGNYVRMIRCGDEHRLNLLIHGIEHPPEVFERFSLRILLKDIASSGLVHVT